MAFSIPECTDEARRALVAAPGGLNGIDYLEVSQDQTTLRVHFLEPLPAGDYGLPTNPALVAVRGGVRIRNLRVVEVRHAAASVLEIEVDRPGDFSTYTLAIDSASLDPVYNHVDFSFKAGCPNRFDCRPPSFQPTPDSERPTIDYMAKDYASFRQGLLDFVSSRKPAWTERHVPDLGIALVELMAYVGDHLSYYQDAVANEAYLDTARQRISVRRHARLIDYRMHDGASARTWVQFRLDPGASGVLKAGAELLTRLDQPLGGALPPFPAALGVAVADLARGAAAVFETMHDVALDHSLNEIVIYTWANRRCCFPTGTTSVDLVGDQTPVLAPGSFLLFEEVKGVATGLPADADRSHRQVVRLTEVELTNDPLLLVVQVLTRVTWDEADALRFPLCLSIQLADNTAIADVSVARGNVALADHGRRREEWHPEPPTNFNARGIATGERAYRFELAEGPLSARVPFDATAPATSLQSTDPSTARAEVVNAELYLPPKLPPLPPESVWSPDPSGDLLGRGKFDPVFAVETNNRGRAQLRFGDNVYGRSPPDGAFFRIEYRTGVGREGIIGAEALGHLIEDPGNLVAGIAAVRNPLPAWGGIDPEPLERVKQLAPSAFHAEQFRAVTEDDYARAAEKHPKVSKAVARFRWTGSWLTVFVTVDPQNSEELTPELKSEVKDWLTRYTMTGYDLEIRSPRYVPLDIELNVCVKRDHFKGDIERALLDLLSSQRLSDGSRGFFHPDRFTFGQSVYLSALYAAVASVPGVDSVIATRFRRQDQDDPDSTRPATVANLDRGSILIGGLEISRLNNDPNFPEHGRLRLNLLGGK